MDFLGLWVFLGETLEPWSLLVSILWDYRANPDRFSRGGILILLRVLLVIFPFCFSFSISISIDYSGKDFSSDSCTRTNSSFFFIVDFKLFIAMLLVTWIENFSCFFLRFLCYFFCFIDEMLDSCDLKLGFCSFILDAILKRDIFRLLLSLSWMAFWCFPSKFFVLWMTLKALNNFFFSSENRLLWITWWLLELLKNYFGVNSCS